MLAVRTPRARRRAARAASPAPEQVALTEADLDRLEEEALGSHLEQRVDPRALLALVAEARAARALREERELTEYRVLLRAQELAFELLGRS